ncbi:FecR domain-containing protein [Herbaspirillum sp. alder98]|uniref:FecR domain-containing protein n=1 Tax=Herbaspirillum sp. alder98 TaxID=2913096 RepID=UPI001CD8DB0B|nr:FecR domain-containing protein [Herbaspirillum sp. alder98]MCA1326156.1 FecR domain-containing protein [Herbaspirillum sp. alder98]
MNTVAGTTPCDADIIAAKPGPGIVAAAIEWMVRLQSGSATAADHEACRCWRAEDPTHELAWSRLEVLRDGVATLPPALAHATVGDSAARRKHARRFALKALSVILVTGVAGGLASHAPWEPLLAQYSTRNGQRRRVVLADGTILELNTATAVDISYDGKTRLVQLHCGEILITTAPDNAAQHRPFIVQTRQGTARALGTRFRLHDRDGTVLVAVFEGAVEFSGKRAGNPTRIDAGHQGLFDADGPHGAQQRADDDAVAWKDGMIVAERMPLGQLVAELSRYRSGWLRCDEAVASLPISGVFPIDQPARILAAVVRTLPVQVDAFTSYWITLRPKNPA